MKQTLRELILVMVVVGLAALAPEPLPAENIWPSMSLPVPGDPSSRTYLGIDGTGDFPLQQIEARLLVVQIFSMYCPICQREAPRVNALFDLIAKSAEISGKVKLIGIGAGNSDFEVDFYRQTYGVPFPLFADGDYVIHKKTGEVGTPYFYLLKRDKTGRLHPVYAKAGAFESPEGFYQLILEKLD